VADPVVIVGGGVAAHGAVLGLRKAGETGPVVMLAREPESPYQRPPLSKRYLSVEAGGDRKLLALPPTDAEVRAGVEVAEVSPDAHRVRLADGGAVPYSRLLLATGGRARVLGGFEDALTLRRVGDADRLRAVLDAEAPMHVIGAGFIGCEIAAAARERNVPVTVYEQAAAPLERVIGAELGAWLGEVHRGRGVDLRLGLGSLPAMDGTVLAAVGSEPDTDLAQAAGIACDRGVLVDELGRTSAPDVYAAGDCARFMSPLYGERVRVEHFQTAQRHGQAVGRAMAGAEEPFAEAPWFWSDQYDVNLQYIGAGLPWDALLVRGTVGAPPFTVLYLSGGRVVAAAGVNDGRTITALRRILERRLEVTPEQLADPATDLRALSRS
jgi:3-phenylpropionate/trans-cinnamate dioxygenase ferredoxin reductase component